MKKLILKTRVKVSVRLLGPSTHVSVMANCKGTHTPMHVLKKSGEREDNETVRLDFTSNFVHGLAFGTPTFYIVPYGIIYHALVNLGYTCNCYVKSGLRQHL